MSCSRFHLLVVGVLATAGIGASSSRLAAETAAADPVAAVRALYSSTADTRLDSVYEMATRRLRTQMMARGLCTVPLRQRVIRCTDTIGLLGPGVEVGNAVGADAAGRTVVTISRANGAPRKISFVFVRRGTGWLLDEIAAPGVSDWPLQTRTPEPAPSLKPQALPIDGPVASAPMRRADRQRRLTREN